MRVRQVVVGMIAGLSLYFPGLTGPAWSQPDDAPPPKPAERSPLLVEPKTPEEAFSATLLMLDLARLDLARKYLEQFLAANPNNATLIKLRDANGTSEFLRLSRVKELQPESMQLLKRLNAAASQQASDPAFQATLLARLERGGADRELAIHELRNLGTRAVPVIFNRIPQVPATKREQFVTALVKMGPVVIQPAIACLDSPNDDIRAAAAAVLGMLKAQEAVPYLWGIAFGTDQTQQNQLAALSALGRILLKNADRADQLSSAIAAQDLRKTARGYYLGKLIPPGTEGESTTLWSWDVTRKSAVSQSISKPIASAFLATRFSRAALALSPDSTAAQRDYLAAALQYEVLTRGWEQPLVFEPGTAAFAALTSGPDPVSGVLADAVANGRPATANAAALILGQIGSQNDVRSSNSGRAPLIMALNYPDQRVQFAAAAAILQIDPDRSFAGAPRVVEIFARSLTDSTKAKALLLDADKQRSVLTAQYVAELGFEPQTVYTGREGFKIAAENPGISLIITHANIAQWDLTPTLVNLRADGRTAAIPVIIYGTEADRVALERVALRYGPAVFVAESGSSSDFQGQLKGFLQTLQSPPLSAEERSRQRAAAIYWFSQMAIGQRSKIYDLNPVAAILGTQISDPQFSEQAIIGLSAVGTPKVQQQLLASLTDNTLSVETRTAATLQLSYHIQRHGLLLKQSEIEQLHSLGQQPNDPRLTRALAALSGSLKPNPQLVGDRLRAIALPLPGKSGDQ